MEVRVGQWVRGTHKFINDIPRIRFLKVDELTKICNWPHYKGLHKDAYNKNMYIRKEDIIKIADTPQELIQVGDLVEIGNSNNRVLQVDRLHHDIQCVEFNDIVICYDQITKIFTPNKDKSVYTLQWEQTKI